MDRRGFDVKERLWDMIKDIKFGMFTTRDIDRHLRARPMTTQNSRLDADASLWFLMSRGGEAVLDLRSDPNVSVVYADTGKDRYVSVSGIASLSDDRAKLEEIWSPLAKAWFPGGVDDPDLALVRVELTHADTWDVKASKAVQLWRLATAAVSGERATGLGEHARVDLR
jgi:general stress protein 26